METIQKTVASLPHEPGVYLYHDENDCVIYVGKAIDLSRRVKQYFQKDDAVGDKTKRLVSEIKRIEIIPVSSEFDALLLEAKLIRKYMPKYNVIARDDKSPLYIGFILSEDLPHIQLLRKGELSNVLNKRANVVYGPFSSAHALRVLLRQVRYAVPYCTQKTRNGKPCFYTHLTLCKPCPSEIVKYTDDIRIRLTKLYRKNVFRLKAIFDGKANIVRHDYERTMLQAAKELRFEEAEEYKKRIDTIYSISQFRYDPAIFLERGVDDVYDNELNELIGYLKPYYPTISNLQRIECFDMSQLFGTYAVGSMVVLSHGKPDTSQYRRFKIRSKGTISDVGMMKEVITRRIKHAEWPTPQFILIDGGKAQLSAVKNTLMSPYAGLAKRQEELIIPFQNSYKTVHLPLSGKAIKVLQRARDEAHRYAISYHRLLRENKLDTILKP